MRKLMLHQQQALNWALNRARIALFMEMRLGKTLVVIRWVQELKLKKVLVLVPSSVIISWQEEFIEEKIKDYTILSGTVPQRLEQAKKSNSQFVVTNYETVTYGKDILLNDWTGIILDESTRIKNPKSNISKILCSCTNHISHKAILTGYPDPEGIADYYQQMKFLFGSFMGATSFWTWRLRNFYQSGFKWTVFKNRKPIIVNKLSEVSYFLNRKQAGLFKRKIYEKRYVTMNSVQRRLYNELIKEFQTTYGTDLFTTKYAIVQAAWLGRVASGFTPDGKHLISDSKHKEIHNLLSTEFKNQKVVIWFRYNSELLSVAKYLRKHKYKVGVYYGGDKSGRKKFTHGTAQVLCIQQKCGMVGLNFSIASTAIYYSNWWSSEMREQSEDRILSVKKKEALLIIDLICSNTVDRKVVLGVKRKKMNSTKMTKLITNYIIKEKK
jgi:SNF2 family DNA or RNA helicase